MISRYDCSVAGLRLPYLTVDGKGGKVRRQYVPARAYDELVRMRVPGHAYICPLEEGGREIADPERRKIALDLEMGKARRATGTSVTLHSLRRRYATEIYRETRDLMITRDALRHNSVVTTQIYVGLADDELRSAIESVAGRM